MEENRLDMVNLYVRQNVRSGVSEVKNPEQGVEEVREHPRYNDPYGFYWKDFAVDRPIERSACSSPQRYRLFVNVVTFKTQKRCLSS